MKHLKLFFALFAMLALGVGNAWAEEVTETIMMKGFGGKTNNAYQNVTVSGTSDAGTAMVAYAYNGSNGQVRGNKTTVAGASVTSEDKNKNWSLYNSEAMGGSIKSITVTQTATGANKFQNNLYVSLGTSSQGSITAITNAQKQDAGGTAQEINFTIDASKGYTYFKLLSTEKFVSNSIAGVVVTVTYETASSGGGETPVTISLNKTELNLQAGATETLTATVTGSTSPVTWTTDNATIATVNAGTVTAVAAGTTTITAAIGDVKATCSVTVTAASTPEEPGTGGEETWTLVTNASDLKTGDQIVIAATESDDALGTTQNTNNRVAVGVTKGTNTITIGDDVQIITLETGNVANTFAFNTGSAGYLYAASSTANNLKTKTTLDDNGSWAISITSAGVATIQAKGTNTRNLLKKNSSSALFSCYGSGQSDVSIYKKVTSTDEPGSTESAASLSASTNEIDFGTVYQGTTIADKMVVVNFENLTSAVTYSGLSTPFTATGAISASGDKITISADASSIGDYSQTLTIQSVADSKSVDVTVTMNVVKAPVPTGTFELYSGELTEGDYVFVVDNVAMTNTVSSKRLSNTSVTIAEDKIENPSENIIWHVAQSGEYWTIFNEAVNAYAASTGVKNNAQMLADGTDEKVLWSVAESGTAFNFENKSNKAASINAKLQRNGEYGWACYAEYSNISLYKKSDGKQSAGLAYETNKYLVKLGAFITPTLTNPNLLVVTYSSSDNNVAEVAADGKVTTKAVGTVEITATFAGNETHREGSATYTICVTEHAGTEADPYSVADARRVIDVMETAEGVYATGIVSEIVTAYNSEYGNITYNISIDGTTVADQLQAYRGKGVNGENFSSANDIKVGDEVVVKGNLKKYETTYEFDADNQLVSLKRDKQQAGLAYEEKEHTANVGEDFTEPTLSNPYSLSITYSSSNTTLATVNETTGEVSILAAGKVTITASSAADATYAAGSASYNITITDPSLAVATLPFAFNGNKAAIETTAGMTQNGLGSDYSASTAPNSQLKFDGTGDWVVIRFDSEPEKLSYDIKNNSFSGGKFSVQESADGETYTDVAVHTTITDIQSEEYELNSASRYVKFIYTTKSSGNVGLGNITITKPDLRAEAGIAWNPATVSLTVGDAFTATFNNPNGLSGITFVSDNETLATVDNAGTITLVSGKTGTATITATFADGHAYYKPAEATCVITVSPKSEKVVILAQYGDQWYAMMAQYVSGKTSHLAALPVTYVGGKLYNVADADKTLIEWERAVVDGKATFSNNSKYLTGKSDKTDLTLAATSCNWTISGDSYLIGERTFLYNAENNWFRNFGTSNADNKNYSGMPTVTAPVYATGDAYGRSVNLGEDGYRYGTICLPFGSTNFTGAEFFECVGKEEGKVYIASVTTLVAGTPYIFLASATEVAVYGDGTTAATPGSKNGLVGTFTNDTEVAIGNYILKDNELCQAETICWVNANRAYLVMEDVPGEFTKMPGRRYIGMSTKGENAETGLENIIVPEGQAVKVISNGQLIIIRDGEMYNAQGQKL